MSKIKPSSVSFPGKKFEDGGAVEVTFTHGRKVTGIVILGGNGGVSVNWLTHLRDEKRRNTYSLPSNLRMKRRKQFKI